eukprot:CAMPEP_0171464884 /NCGR_PEP_ID=MMETSP0945-20130129/8081_1 /TAXON_ID=109269 /ORGANISM="Vaucheria litorea, Strain CCMP2940" /LENGTH=186 /DNA_ID=CAMNT_0011992175 /DNA_START=65 /DNA_END=622 /DNA_ORIENTATION=-
MNIDSAIRELSDMMVPIEMPTRRNTMGKHSRQYYDSIIENINDSKERKHLSYRPLNYSDYLERLRTFSSLNWSLKAKYLSPSECSIKGWEVKARETLVCQSCNALIEEKIFVESTGGEASSLLTQFHTTFCPWKQFHSPKSFESYPTATNDDFIQMLKSRLKSFLEIDELTASFTIPDERIPSTEA